MMLRNLLACLFCLAAVTLADARLIENWSYERLLAAADLVVIGSMGESKAWDKPLEVRQFADALEARATTFKVEGVLKGKPAGATIELLHFRLKENAAVENGPWLAEFRKEGRRLEIVAVDGVQERRQEQEGTPHYLLFLKARPDGRFEPVAGQVDSALSVRQVQSF